MPATFFRPLDRRNFLALSVKAFAAGAMVRAFTPFPVLAADTPLRLALLSDTHVAADPKSENGKFVPWDNLQLTVSQVLETNLRAVILNGDAARATGELEDYQAVKGLLTPLAERCPVHIGLGNHDNRENLHKVFLPDNEPMQKIPEKRVLLLDEPLLRIIVLDSLLYVNKVPGLLGKAQRQWLEKHLASSDSRPTVLFVHHTLGDGDGELLDAAALRELVRPYAKVKAIFYGHSHEYNYRQDHGIHLVNLPAIGYNFADKEPVGWVDALFSATGVDLTLRALGGNRAQDGKTTSLTWRGA